MMLRLVFSFVNASSSRRIFSVSPQQKSQSEFEFRNVVLIENGRKKGLWHLID